MLWHIGAAGKEEITQTNRLEDIGGSASALCLRESDRTEAEMEMPIQ